MGTSSGGGKKWREEHYLSPGPRGRDDCCSVMTTVVTDKCIHTLLNLQNVTFSRSIFRLLITLDTVDEGSDRYSLEWSR